MNDTRHDRRPRRQSRKHNRLHLSLSTSAILLVILLTSSSAAPPPSKLVFPAFLNTNNRRGGIETTRRCRHHHRPFTMMISANKNSFITGQFISSSSSSSLPLFSGRSRWTPLVVAAGAAKDALDKDVAQPILAKEYDDVTTSRVLREGILDAPDDLQTRFREAMKRREERRVKETKAVSSMGQPEEEEEENGASNADVMVNREKRKESLEDIAEVMEAGVDATTTLEGTVEELNEDENLKMSATSVPPIDDDTLLEEDEDVEFQSRDRSGRGKKKHYKNEPHSKYRRTETRRSMEVDQSYDYPRTSKERVRDDRYEDDRYYSNSDLDDPYYDDYEDYNDYRDDEANDNYNNYNNYDNYNDNYNNYNSNYDKRRRPQKQPPPFEWETYKSSSILFPKLPTPASRPKAILHFVGGTFFGSYPRKFYGSLLEDIATKCDAVVVATPIPLVLPGKRLMNQLLDQWVGDDDDIDIDDWNDDDDDVYQDVPRRRRRRPRRTNVERRNENPLDHLQLAESIQREFNSIYRDVLLDEYCSDRENDIEEFMKGVPIVGMGHSLGARIQAVSCSHPRVSERYLSMGKGRRRIRSGRDGMIYLGFANWGASSSIPGVESLERTVAKRRRREEDDERASYEGRRRGERYGRGAAGGGRRRRDNVWGEDSEFEDDEREKRYRGKDSTTSRRTRRTRYEDLYEEAGDLDIFDVFSGMFNGVANGAKQIGEALTPAAEDLEFYPTPEELWDDLSSSQGVYSRNCLKTLIIQFDEDPIDQGARLARTLLSAYSDEAKSTNSTEAKVEQNQKPHDVKFARLKGGHLTPVTVQEGIAKILPRGAMSLFSSSSDFLLRQLGEEGMGKPSKRQRREVQDVADTIASYITEVIYEEKEKI